MAEPRVGETRDCTAPGCRGTQTAIRGPHPSRLDTGGPAKDAVFWRCNENAEHLEIVTEFHTGP